MVDFCVDISDPVYQIFQFALACSSSNWFLLFHSEDKTAGLALSLCHKSVGISVSSIGGRLH